MTRHELKDQLQHDQFTDAVSGAVGYASSHRQGLIRWGAIAAVALALIGGFLWYRSSQAESRRQDLASAMSILDATVGQPAANGKTYSTEDAKQDAWMKAISDVVAKDGGTPEGLIAQYYRGTSRSQKNDIAGAESDLRTVANSSAPVAPLAKIALASVYLGEKKDAEAKGILEELVKDPSGLVSKAQAQILLAQLGDSANPQAAKDVLKTIDAADAQRAAVKNATQQLNSTLTK